MSPAPDPVDLFGAADPAAAFRAAHREGRRVALRTSGTTGRPRTVVRTTQSWVASFDAMSDLAELTPGSSVWIPGPLTATMNLFAVVHADAVGVHRVSRAQDASHAVLTPLTLSRALDSGVLRRGLTVVVAGDVISPDLRERCAQDGIGLHHYYGASELSFVAWGAREPDLALFPGVECRIVDGEIWVSSPYLSDGYLEQDPDGPMRWAPDGFVTVGDRGELRDGVLAVHGRGDAGITTAGVTVVVADVETTLRGHARGTVVVVGLPDDRLGAVVCGVVTDAQDVPILRAAARSGLEPAQRPTRWYVLPSVPMTDSGKPDREHLVAVLARGDIDPVVTGRGGTMTT